MHLLSCLDQLSSNPSLRSLRFMDRIILGVMAILFLPPSSVLAIPRSKALGSTVSGVQGRLLVRWDFLTWLI